MKFFSLLPKVEEVFLKKRGLGHYCTQPYFSPTFEENVDFLNSDCDETQRVKLMTSRNKSHIEPSISLDQKELTTNIDFLTLFWREVLA